MRKFECKKCLNNCIVLANDYYLPKTCCYDFGYKPDWHEVEDSAENAHTTNDQFGKTEQLPDWVKVGNLVYCSKTGNYGEIKTIKDNKIYLRLINTDEVLPVKLNMVLKNGRPARKRPFNEAEMKALVGKIIEFENGDTTLAIGYSEKFDEGAEGYSYGIWTCWGWSMGATELMNECTIDDKPCYVLEHLENGEWVE